MALLHTPEKQNDFKAPDFSLKDTQDQTQTLSGVRGEQGTLVMFICNHCPYVVGIIDRIVSTSKTLQNMGFGVIAVMANDAQTYPADSLENMKIFAREHGFTFPYVIDEIQDIARAYDAVCTPDFFLFNRNDLLCYRGRLDSAANKPATADTDQELLNAAQSIKSEEKITEQQHSSMGCSIKWKT